MSASPFPTRPREPRRGADVCIVGNLCIDVIMRGIEEMPRWGEEVLSSSRVESAAGQAGGMAFACARLDLRTEVVADVGGDETGRRIRGELEGAGVGVGALNEVAGATTPVTVAVVRADGERAFISDLGTLPAFDVSSVVQRSPGILDAGVVALVGTANLAGIDLDAAASLLERASAAGSLIVFDSGWDPSGWSPRSVEAFDRVLAQTDLYLPNLDEARALTGREEVAEVLGELARRCRGTVVVKAGEDGSYVMVDGDPVHVAAFPTVVDNAVGAGDVFNAGVVAGYLHGRSVLDSMALGSAAASLYVSRRHERFADFGQVEALAARAVTTSSADRSPT